ncbi:MAG: shikimate kinase [Pseudomonadota bacterium]
MHVVFLHGPPAAGKYTVGRALAARLDWPLFHNHLAVDTALALFPFGSDGFVQLRAAIWRAAFHEAAAAKRNFIFTFNPETTVAPALIDELTTTLAAQGGAMHFIQLDCDPATIVERIAAPGRAAFGKLTDVELYRQLEANGSFDFPPLPPPLVQIDTGKTTPHDAAQKIAARLDEVCR